MLSFDEKKEIFRSFKLKEKKISNGRVSFVYPKSKQRGQVLATQLHPSGNGYVVGKYMSEETVKDHKYEVDPRGWISIKDFSKPELTTVITEAMNSMSGENPEDPVEESIKKTTVQNEGRKEDTVQKITGTKSKIVNGRSTSEEITPIENTPKENEHPIGKVLTSIETKLSNENIQKSQQTKLEMQSEIKEEPSHGYETTIGIMLNNWLKANVLIAELGLTVWRQTAKRVVKL